MNRRLVIVVGCQRSGTTLVGQILGARHQAVVIDEEDGLYDWAFALLGKRELVREEVDWREVCRRARRKYAEPDERVTREGVLQGHVEIVVLKAPNLTYSWAEIAREVPDSMVVYLGRDPRAIVASMLRLSVPFVANQIRLLEQHAEALELYRETVAGWRRDDMPMYLKMAELAAIKMSFADRFEAVGLPVLRVRYERLVSSPEGEVPRLLEFAGLGLGTRAAPSPGLTFVGTGPGGTNRTRSIDTQSLVRWRRDLTRNQQGEILERARAVAGAPDWLDSLPG